MESLLQKDIQPAKSINLLIPVCAAVSIIGAVTGTIVYSKALSDADIQAYIDAQKTLPTDFDGYFAHTIIYELIFQAAAIILGLFALGWIFVLPLVFYGGLGVGTSVCCLCQQLSWFGAVYSFAQIVVPFLCFVIARSVLYGAAMELSYGMFINAAGSRRSAKKRLLSMAIKIPLCGVIDIFAAALAAILRTVLHTIVV